MFVYLSRESEGWIVNIFLHLILLLFVVGQANISREHHTVGVHYFLGQLLVGASQAKLSNTLSP